jgi:hypothetical protein
MDKNSNEFVKITAEIDKNKLKIKMPAETRISHLAEYLKRQAKLSPT